MNCKTAVVFCAAAFFLQAHAQSILGLTFPYGVPVQGNSGMSLTMGGAGCGVAGDHNVMLKNPANLGLIDRAVLSALYSVDVLRISDASLHSNFISGVPTQVSIGIPFGIAGTVGLSYDLRSDRSAFFRDSAVFAYSGGTATFKEGFAARGGLVSWQVGWGYSILKVVQVGISYERFYLSTEQTRLSTLTFEGVETNSRDSMKVEGRCNGVRAGVQVPAGKLRFGIAGEYNFECQAQSFKGVYPTESNVPLANTYQTETFTLRLPSSMSLGVSYDISPEWLVASDVAFGFWQQSQASGMLAKPGVTATTGVSLGAQYIPAPNLLTPKYWETMRYRAGFRYTELPGANSHEYMLSLGTGFPLGRGFGLLDIGAEIGRRESGQFKGYSEDVVRIGIGFNGGHKWARPVKGTY